MSTGHRLAAWLLMAMSWQIGGAAEPISKNPFTRPGYTADRPLPDSPAQFQEQQEPELKATLIAGRRALANLSGEILAPGDEFRGYRLLRVREGEALLMRDGQPITLYVRQQAKEDARE